MKINRIDLTPLAIPYKTPYYWSQGIVHNAEVILVSVHTDEGITGYGESIASRSSTATEANLQIAAKHCIGQSPFQNQQLVDNARHELFRAFGTTSSPRYAGQILAGLEMALWDAMGKACRQPVHQMLGGKFREDIQYFGFPQGDTPEEIAAATEKIIENGCDVIYVKVGRGDLHDLEVVRRVREVIGPDRRLRLDPNEHWNPLTAARMIRKLEKYDIDFVEQPSHCESIAALAHIRANSPVALSADQSVFTPFDAFEICRQNAADVITLGLHETGGITRFRQTAAVAEAADINICLHGLYESGITTCATNQAAATIKNLDDGNQYMNHFLAWDIIDSPDLTLRNGSLPVINGPGLGFELDEDAVARAHERHAKSHKH